MVYVVLKRHYPDFDELVNSIADHRQRKSYEVAELIMAGLSMFIFKRGSRHQADLCVNASFERNYAVVFGMRIPIMDTVDVFLRKLDPEELEKLKKVLVKQLIEKKVLEKWKYGGRYLVSVDGTGLCSYDYEPYKGCPHKTSKNGKTTWQAYALEAKLVGANGFCISLISCWLENSENMDEKQDCEIKAFCRLSKALKKAYPRLPLLLLADGLYANQTVFGICLKNDWRFIITFKEGNLKTVWQEIGLLLPLHSAQKLDRIREKSPVHGWLKEQVQYINDLDYLKYRLHWVQYKACYDEKEPHEYFSHISDIRMDKVNGWQISQQGRLRWCIENEGFNIQKNGGYNLEHKFSRKELWAKKNYYELLQIAHLINQLVEKLQHVKSQLQECKVTLTALWEDIMACMRSQIIDNQELVLAMEEYNQLRY
ncbi:hypothetical protein GALL_429830 [mine drainage metagenome]|jgi:hypothetical protein|uniref:Transposase n=1 Tax=mine drainage metagenome TaxID=410659 RepID=A0A1J5Q5T5_9ZZZZ